mmetsp:Transcript_72720/g.115416  ORF Transcript_72720/g.115416 Transcript_72720/m.115416 type:complete len:92 (+) Transcript_72720:610-885(+)
MNLSLQHDLLGTPDASDARVRPKLELIESLQLSAHLMVTWIAQAPETAEAGSVKLASRSKHQGEWQDASFQCAPQRNESQLSPVIEAMPPT